VLVIVQCGGDPPGLGCCQRWPDDLRQFVFEHTENGPVATDWKFRSQIGDAADGVGRNIAEGFGRYGHRDFARFLTIAKGSLNETQDCLIAGHRKRYFDEETLTIALQQVGRTNAALLGLLRYLRRSAEPGPLSDR
jgi:four helix bundle protein